MRRRIIGTMLAGALAVGIAGCSGTGQNMPQEPPARPVSMSPEDAYLSEVGRDVPAARDIPSRDLIEYGETVCLALDHGLTVEDLGRIAGERGIPPHIARQLAQIAGTAVRNLCPEHVATVHGQLTR